MRRVATEHCDTGAKLGPAKGNHMLSIDRNISKGIPSVTNLGSIIPNMAGNDLTLMSGGVHQNPLDEIVSILISCDFLLVSIP